MKRVVITIDKESIVVDTVLGLLLTHDGKETLTVSYGTTKRSYINIPFNSRVSIIVNPETYNFSLRRMYPPHSPQKIFNAYFRTNVTMHLSEKATALVYDKKNGIVTLPANMTLAELYARLSTNPRKLMIIVNMLDGNVSSLTVREWLTKFSHITYTEDKE